MVGWPCFQRCWMKCANLEIEVIDVAMPILNAAAEMKTGVSFNDRLCFLVCLERRWTCVANDRALRHLCRHRDVKVRYGLGLMVDLVKLGAIDRRRASAIARRMQKANPSYINERVLERFARALTDAG